MINLKEFFALVNNAYAFLGVKMDMALAEAVFKEADKDHDGYITYVEYFQYIEKCICQTRERSALYRLRVCRVPEAAREGPRASRENRSGKPGEGVEQPAEAVPLVAAQKTLRGLCLRQKSHC